MTVYYKNTVNLHLLHRTIMTRQRFWTTALVCIFNCFVHLQNIARQFMQPHLTNTKVRLGPSYLGVFTDFCEYLCHLNVSYSSILTGRITFWAAVSTGLPLPATTAIKSELFFLIFAIWWFVPHTSPWIFIYLFNTDGKRNITAVAAYTFEVTQIFWKCSCTYFTWPLMWSRCKEWACRNWMLSEC